METNVQNKKWVFVVVHKERIIKELDKAYLINLGGKSTILPKVFKRTKEHEEKIFFSLPQDFRINVRYSVYVPETHSYDEKDIEYSLQEFDENVISIKDIAKPIPTDVVE